MCSIVVLNKTYAFEEQRTGNVLLRNLKRFTFVYATIASKVAMNCQLRRVMRSVGTGIE